MKKTEVFTKENFSDKLVKIIRADIVHGEYQSGEILRETQLAKEWNISRSPVREALRTLEQQQLLVRLSNGSYQVTELTLEYIGHFYDTIQVLLDYAIAHPRIFDFTEEDKNQAEKLMREMEKSIEKEDFDTYIQASADLIFLLVRKTGNPIIEKIALELIPIGSRIMWTAITNVSDIPERIMKDTRNIYENILHKNTRKAIALFHSTILLAREMTVEKLSAEKSSRNDK